MAISQNQSAQICVDGCAVTRTDSVHSRCHLWRDTVSPTVRRRTAGRMGVSRRTRRMHLHACVSGSCRVDDVRAIDNHCRRRYHPLSSSVCRCRVRMRVPNVLVRRTVLCAPRTRRSGGLHITLGRSEHVRESQWKFTVPARWPRPAGGLGAHLELN